MYIGHILAFVNFIRENPGFASWLIGGLFTIIATLVAVYYALIYQRIGKLEVRVETVEVEVSDVKGKLEKYEDHIGVGEKAISELIPKLERITDSLTTIQVENTRDHAKIIEGRTVLVERIAKIETKLDGSNLSEILDILRGMKKSS